MADHRTAGAAAPIPSAVLAAFPTTSTTAPSPHELLQQLAGWMSASGYVADHPWQVAIAGALAAHADPAPAPAPAALRPGRDRADLEWLGLHAVLAALALLSNCVRVLRDLEQSAGVWPELSSLLRRACPDWKDPLCHGGAKSGQAVLCELARFAADLGAELANMNTTGSAA